MKRLRFTTSKPGFLGTIHEPLVVPKDLHRFIKNPLKPYRAYIHGDAENLAGYDMPIYLDGDINQLGLPAEEQDIQMLLPSGEYAIVATLQTEGMDKGDYYLTLKK